jgi:uncharacterized protein (DUF2252 family)
MEESDADRIPGLIPVKYQRMAVSPFTFYRGAAIIQARDLASARVSGITVQACGDCHLANFGGFASPERVLVFDINDFDETFPGPWEWDVKRLGASLVLAARDRSFSKAVAGDAVRAAAASYRERMAESGFCVGSGMGISSAWMAGIANNSSARESVTCFTGPPTFPTFPNQHSQTLARFTSPHLGKGGSVFLRASQPASTRAFPPFRHRHS